MASRPSPEVILEKYDTLLSLLKLRVEGCEKLKVVLRKEINAREKLMGILRNGSEDREAPVAALGKVTATQDIFGPRMEALNAEAAAAVSEKKALLTQNEDVYAQAEELDIWLENNTEGRWKRVTISATVTSA
jgi:hypothetical protein